jgi:NitT/TauT family transport system permease protein
VFAGLLLVAAMSIVLYAFCALLERRMAGWAFRGQVS